MLPVNTTQNVHFYFLFANNTMYKKHFFFVFPVSTTQKEHFCLPFLLIYSTQITNLEVFNLKLAAMEHL